jgi:hypothetical protein
VHKNANAYLKAMEAVTDDPGQYKHLFRRWTFAANLTWPIARRLDRWIDGNPQVSSLRRLTTILQTPTTALGGGAYPLEATIVLLDASMAQVLVVSASNSDLAFPSAPVNNETVPKRQVLGNALAAASRGLHSQTGYGMSKTYVFLGERQTDQGAMLYIFKLTGPKPGQVLGKRVQWVPNSKMPIKFASPAMWAAAFDLPLAVRRYHHPGNKMTSLRRTLISASSSKERAALLAFAGARPKDLVFVITGSVHKMTLQAPFAHPVLTVPETSSISDYVKLLGITHIHTATCEDSLCAKLRTQFPSLVIYDGVQLWAPDQTLPRQQQNPALVARKQGTPGFIKWFYKVYGAELEKLGRLPFECTPDGTPYRSQQLAIYLASPACPAIQRLLADHRTGSGKTKIMHLTLGNYHKSDMPKVVIVPTPELRRNFFNKLVNTKTRLSDFVRRAIPALPETGPVNANLIRDNLTNIMKLLAMRHQSGRYQLKRYKTYLQEIASGRAEPPYGTEPWAPMSPLRCESFGSLETMFTEIDDTPAAFAAFEAGLKAGSPCVPSAKSSTQYMFQPHYRYKQDGEASGSKLIKNPFDDKIIMIDEMHELFTRPSDNPVKRRMLRLLLKYARGGTLVGLTATPIVPGDKDQSQLLDIIKGPDAAALSSEGFISYFNDLVQPLFPTTIPHLFQRLQGGTVPVLGRIVFSPLYGANYLKYMDRARQIRGQPSTKDLRALQTFLNTIYANASAGRNGGKLVGANLADFAANANKLDCLDKLINQYPNDKTLVLFAGGARSYMEYVKRKYPGRLLTGDEGAPIKPKERMGFLFRLTDPKKVRAQNELLGWFSSNVNLDGSRIRVMCANAQRFGTGVDFPGIRHLILVNVPHDVTTYLQELGRTMRSCAYAPLPEKDRNVRVDLMVATLDPKRALDDLMDKTKFNQLLDAHAQNPNQPKLTYDELHLWKLYTTFDAQMAQLDKLIAAPAIDKPWLQNLVPADKAHVNFTNDSTHVIYCDSKPADLDVPLSKEKSPAISIPPGRTETLDSLLENLTLPPISSIAQPSLLDPAAPIESIVVSNREDLIHALLSQHALGLLTMEPVDVDKDVPTILARCNVRWTALAAHDPTFTRVTRIQLYSLEKSTLTMILYIPNAPLDKDSRNLRAIAQTLGLDSTTIQRPPLAVPSSAAEPSDSDAVVERLKRTLYKEEEEAININNPTRDTRTVTVFVGMYFPDLSIDHQTLDYDAYKHQPMYVTGILKQVRQVLHAFFTPHTKFITVRKNKNQISAQVQNVPLAWLKRREPDQPRLYYQLEHLNGLPAQAGWRVLPYKGKLVIGLEPIKLDAVGHLEPRDILTSFDGDVYLDEDDAQPRLLVKKAPTKLAVRINDQLYQSNPVIAQAQAQRQPAAYLETLDPPLIVPTKVYASIKDFAVRAPRGEWDAFWRFTDSVRERHAPTKIYFSTDPLPSEAGFFALHVLAQPGYPAWKLADWKYKQADQERLAQAQKYAEEVPIEQQSVADPASQQQQQHQQPLVLPPIRLPEEESETPLLGNALKPAVDPKDTLLTLIITYTDFTGDPQLILVERSTALETTLSLPLAKVPAKTIGYLTSVKQVIDRAVQRDGLMPVDVAWVQTKTDPIAIIKLSPGSILDRLGYSPNGAFTGRRPWPLRKLPELPSKLDGRSIEILRRYAAHLKMDK